MNEIKSVLEEQARAFHALKQTVDAHEAAIKAGGSSAEFQAKLEKINAHYDELKSAQKALEAAISRQASGTGEGAPMDETRAAFVSYVRKGIEAKGLAVNPNEDGGYLVPTAVQGPMVERLFDISPIRGIANVQPISGNALEGTVDYGQANVQWLDELSDNDDSATPTLKKYRIEVNRMGASPRASQTILEDAVVNVEAWLAGKLARDFAQAEGAAFVSGSGVSRPRGFTTYTTAATADGSRAWGQLEHVATGSSGSFGTAPNGSDKLIDLVHALKAAYRTGAVFVMNKKTAGAVRQLKADNQYIWLPSMAEGQPDRLLGYPVVEAEDMADFSTANSLAIAFGNFREGYTIVDRTGLSILRNPFKAPPEVIFHAVKRVGGAVVNFEAIKFLKFGS